MCVGGHPGLHRARGAPQERVRAGVRLVERRGHHVRDDGGISPVLQRRADDHVPEDRALAAPPALPRGGDSLRRG